MKAQPLTRKNKVVKFNHGIPYRLDVRVVGVIRDVEVQLYSVELGLDDELISTSYVNI